MTEISVSAQANEPNSRLRAGKREQSSSPPLAFCWRWLVLLLLGLGCLGRVCPTGAAPLPLPVGGARRYRHTFPNCAFPTACPKLSVSKYQLRIDDTGKPLATVYIGAHGER